MKRSDIKCIILMLYNLCCCKNNPQDSLTFNFWIMNKFPSLQWSLDKIFFIHLNTTQKLILYNIPLYHLLQH